MLKLNKEQVEAVKHGGGPLLIIAGAGTGKTTVITERIKYLIFNKLAKPSEILALTFTEKAAREMEERVDVAMPYGYTQMWISTFHSFCDRILRAEALHIGLDPRYKLMREAEVVQLIRSNLFNLPARAGEPAQAGFNLNYFRPLGNPTKFIDGMLQHFSRLQDEDILPSDYLAWVNLKFKIKNSKLSAEEKLEQDKYKELANAYKTYEEIKIRESVMDFGDLIVKTLELLRCRQNILKRYQEQFKYVLVDEFQDTNFAQNELAILLAGKTKNITVCGDDDQSIYRFRGAAVSNILQFRKNFPKAKIVVLTRNYRSTQEILDKSYELIQHNNPDRLEAVEKIDKKLISERKVKGQGIEFIHIDRVENEADLVAKKIGEIISESKGIYQYKDCAILVRANNHSEPFMRAFSRHGIPYQFLGPGRLFKQPEVVDLISYLKVLYNFEDSVAFYRLLSIEFFDIKPRDLAAIGNYARRFNLSLFATCDPPSQDVIDPEAQTRRASEGQEKLWFVSEDTRKKIGKITEIINKHLKLARRETAGQLLYYFLQDTGLLQKLLSPDSAEAEKRAANISKFFDKLKTYEVDHEDATVFAVVDWIELSSELGESPQASDTDWVNINAVNILTVHSSKGLEFPIVFLVNLVGQRFPTIERREQIPIPDDLIKEVLPVGDYHLEEERRLFYVGMTRAKDQLFFTAADYYGEGKREKKLSPFIFEALGDDTITSETARQLDSKQLSFLDYSIPEQLTVNSKQLTALHIDYLSYSQIETFRTCPLHYKLKYIFKVPTAQSASQSFGTSMHLALKNFYLSIKAGEKPTQKSLLSILDEVWISEGFTSKSHERKFLEKGRMFLSEYYKTQFDPKRIPIVLEQPFVVPLVTGDKRQVTRPLKIGGKIDRVDDLGNGKIEIIDYKTGANVPTQRDIDHDLQLTFYALAAVGINEEPFSKRPENVVLTLYYFDNQKKISTTRTNQQLEETKKEIFKIREEIEKSDFACSGNMLCRNCEYSLLCRSEGKF